ncbi:MAG TPA: hypothetical protein VGB73_16580 [Pyrinomonadaceae bacterium]
MSEQQSEQTANAAPAPAVDLIFDGLFFLCFNTGGKPAVNDPAGECRVGFLTTAQQHEIIIKGRRRNPSIPDVVKPVFEHSLSHAEARRIDIDLNVPGVVSPSVTRKGHEQVLNRFTRDQSNEEYFKWILDLENLEMHNTKLPLIRGVLKPVMHINIGEFYSRKLSNVHYFRTKVDADNKKFGAVAAITGVRIATLPRGEAFLNIGDKPPESLVAPAGETFEVLFQNRCFKCDQEELGRLHLSDFQLHYHAFDVQVLDQFDFDFDDVATPPAICYAASGSQTTDI